MLTFITLLIALIMIAFCTVMGLGFGTDMTVPGWATPAAALLLAFLVELMFLAVLFCLIILSGRAGSRFLPARDYHFFVDRVDTVYPRS